MTAITAKNFDSVLSQLLESAEGMASRIQSLVVFGLNHYKEHRDTQYLTRLVEQSKTQPSINTTRLTNYIQAIANIVWKDDKFRKISRKADPEVNRGALAIRWDQFSTRKTEKVVKKVNICNRLDSLLNSIEDNGFVVDDISKLEEYLSELQAFLKTESDAAAPPKGASLSESRPTVH